MSVYSVGSSTVVHLCFAAMDGVIGSQRRFYVGDMCEEFWQGIQGGALGEEHRPGATFRASVSQVLETLDSYERGYRVTGEFPSLENHADVCLFNTYRAYLPESTFPLRPVQHADARGAFAELVRAGSGGQASVSTTRPGVTRGNHFHTRKVERFTVLRGEALIRTRRIGTERVIEYRPSGKDFASVDIPVWYTHTLENIGTEDLLTLFWCNECFDPQNTDTYFEDV